MARLVILACTAGAALAALAPGAAAQQLRGTVSDSASGQPVAGAVVLLLDSAGRTAAQAITTERGLYRLPAAAAPGRLRVLRIGYRPREVPLPAAPGPDVDVTLAAISVLLEAVEVTASELCPRRGDAAAAYALLDQARAGLLAIIVARRTNPPALVRLGYERRMDGLSDRVLRQVVRSERAREGVSFDAVRTPAEFLRLGFAAEQWGGQRFLAPDADVLLDDDFAHGYCFRLADRRRERPGQVGLAFAAAGRLAGRVDIDGTLWVDTVARALVDIEFRYAGLPDTLQHYRPGGRIAFRAMPNGLVVIDRWALRLVGIEDIEAYSMDVMRDVRRREFYYSESGGELARASWPDGTAWRAPLGTLRARLRDAAGAPAAGVVLRLVDTHYRGTADSAGIVTIDDLVPGPYAAAVTDARLTPIGLELPTGLRFVAARETVTAPDLAVPTAESFTWGLCTEGRRGGAAAGPVRILGRLYGPGGRPAARVRVAATRLDGSAPAAERGSYTTGSDGLFAFCLAAADAGTAIALTAGSARAVVTAVPPLTVLRLER